MVHAVVGDHELGGREGNTTQARNAKEGEGGEGPQTSLEVLMFSFPLLPEDDTAASHQPR